MAIVGPRSVKGLPSAVTWTRRFFRFATAAAIGVSLAVACSSSSNNPVGSNSSNGGNSSSSNNTSGGSFSTTTLSDGATVTTETFADGATVIVPPSSSSSTGGGSVDGSSGSVADSGGDAVVCTNTNLEMIPIPSTGFVDFACNVYGIQGSWYCFSDMDTEANGGSEGCIQGAVPVGGTPGNCLSGTIPENVDDYVGIGISLNQGGGDSGKQPYNATASGVVGFAITVTGTITGADLRIGFTNNNGSTAHYVAPFVTEAAPAAGGSTYSVLLAGPPVPSVPGSFGSSVADPDASLNPTDIYDVQVEIPGQPNTAVTYSNFCVTNIVPIFNADAAVPGSCSSMVDIGGQNCSAQDIVDGVDYGFQNNITSSSGECVQAEQGGDCGGFTVTFPSSGFGSGGNVPSSYPSIIYGWSEASPNWHGGLQAPKAISTITSAQTTWTYTGLPSKGDAAYDIWLSSSNTQAPNTSSGLELMIWTGQAGGAVPAGPGNPTTTTIGGTSWQVYKANSSNGGPGAWGYLAYVNTSASPSVDVNAFIQDAENNQKIITSSWYLWSIQAGWEVYNATSTLTTSQFSVTIE